MSKYNLFWIGSGFWLVGIAMIATGIPELAWLPISWGGFALGYHHALRALKERT